MSNVLYGVKEMKDKSKNADDSLQHDEPEPKIKHTRYKTEVYVDEDSFQDEGFLDTSDVDKNNSSLYNVE